MANDELKDHQRVPIMMRAPELRQVDEWRRRRRESPSRSEAIRQLMALGLSVEGLRPHETNDASELDQFLKDQREGSPLMGRRR
jgi:hypothetical protein